MSPLSVRNAAAKAGLAKITRNACSKPTPTSPTGIVARMIIQASRWSAVTIRRSRTEVQNPPMILTQSRRK